MKLTDRRWQAAIAAGVVAVALAAVAVVLLVRGNPPQTVSSRASLYTASTACLLTDSHGVNTAPAATVWAGMQDAAAVTRAKATYLTVSGPGTTANAVPYANSLVQEHCNVVLAVGAPQASALTQIAARNPGTAFVIVSDTTSFATKNLKTIGITPSTRTQVEQAVAAHVS